jgi:hypothetical protein
MGKGRLEAFSDGVIAIIITIMVLELKVPHGATFDDLIPLLPVLGSYVLSFIYVGIYWNKLQHVNYRPRQFSMCRFWRVVLAAGTIISGLHAAVLGRQHPGQFDGENFGKPVGQVF